MSVCLLSLCLLGSDSTSLVLSLSDAAHQCSLAQSQLQALNAGISRETGRLDSINPLLTQQPANDIKTARMLLSMARGHANAAAGLIPQGNGVFDGALALWDAGRLEQLAGRDGSRCYGLSEQEFSEASAIFRSAQNECRDGETEVTAAKAIIDPYFPVIPWWDWFWPMF